MATYMRRLCRNCAVNFRLFNHFQLCPPAAAAAAQRLPSVQIQHTVQGSSPSVPAQSLQFTRPNSTSSRESKPVSDDEDNLVNPLSYPEELEEDAFKTYYGELHEGEERPHMLHMVWRTKSTTRRPWWEKEIMNMLGLGKRHKMVVLKNNTATNELLTRVRHLVRIKPIIFKYGLPNGDYENTLLKQNGEFIVKRKVQGLQVISEEDEELLNKGVDDSDSASKTEGESQRT